ncbi:hypothetical protein [Aquibacillus kalidii]|uniref:hypothetical protein n=1 Tax=Aquibacillus kalidii TaxID=2762597 RepID=UPI001644FF15|nr:hypothetical protein [Aquibacillus kalidii]
MRDENSKLEKWREKYGAIVIALTCLCSAITSWGDNWMLTVILVLGFIVCITIGIFDIKRAKVKQN